MKDKTQVSQLNGLFFYLSLDFILTKNSPIVVLTNVVIQKYNLFQV